jgi:2,3-diketo-5-methylthio-1-phosphopentane phosphatase
MGLVVLCDFDGTITMVDTAELVLAKFAEGDWRVIDRQFELGEITLEECLRREFRLVHVSEKQILEALEGAVPFRPHFDKLVQHCSDNSVPLIIVSAGLDFVIDHFLRLNGWHKSVATYMAKTHITENGIEFAFPPLFDKASANFKQDLVRRYKSQGDKVICIGDGSGDFDAAKEADCVFAIRGSKLARLCQKYEIPFKTITDFEVVVGICEV